MTHAVSRPRGGATRHSKADLCDLVATNFPWSAVHVLTGRGDGTFGEQRHYVTSWQTADAVISDFDGNGTEDIVSSGPYEGVGRIRAEAP